MSTALSILALVLAVVVIVACIGLQLQLKDMRRAVATLDAEVTCLEPALPIPPNLAPTFGSGTRRIITIEIMNPIELATSRMKVAAVVGAVRPSLIKRLVYGQAVKQIAETLEEEGVVAEVRIRRAE